VVWSRQVLLLLGRISIFPKAVNFKWERRNGTLKDISNSVKCAQGAHLDRLFKTVPKGAGSYANSGINRHRRFMRL
jgi:hypothetical protein